MFLYIMGINFDSFYDFDIGFWKYSDCGIFCFFFYLYHHIIKHYSLNEFVETYNVNSNFVKYQGIISTIPNNWKQIILGETIKFDRICIEIVLKKKMQKTNLVNIFTNQLFREFSKNLLIVIQMGNDLEASVENWYGIDTLSFYIARDAKIQNFQFKLLHKMRK